MSNGIFVDGSQELLASAFKQPEELGRIAPDGSVTLNWNVIAACAQNWKSGVLDNSGFAKLLLAARATQPAQAAQGAGEVVAWQASDGGSSYISNEARSRNIAFRELYTIPLYTQPAAGADVLDAERYRWLRAQDNEDFAFAVVKNPHFDVYESPEELDAHIDAAIAASGRQE